MITVGEVLKKQRGDLNKSLKEISLETKIQQRFLEYLEANDFGKFDSPVYAQGLLKVYSKAIDLDEDRVMAIYRRSQPQTPQKAPSKGKKVPREMSTNLHPKTIGIILSILFFLGILGYIGYQIYEFQSPPEITITTPEDETITDQESITVSGSTELNSSLLINDSLIELSDTGEFTHDITLNEGINLITITARKNNNTLENVTTLKVTYEAPENNKEEENDEQPNLVRLEIINSSVWVQFNVDKINQISQIVQVGETFEYEVSDNFSITTGKVGSTEIYFNDILVDIPTNSSNVGELSCEITEDNQIDCE